MAENEVLEKITPARLFKHILRKYFRIRITEPLDEYITAVKNKPREVRVKLAQNSDFPPLLDILAEDSDPYVEEAAHKNQYWILLGQYKHLLKMPREDKIAFAKNESLSNLLVLIIYETDLEVLKVVFLSPELSIQMLTILKKYLKQRGFGTKDSLILDLVEKAIQTRKERLIKITSLLKIKEEQNPDTMIPFILKYFLDDDEVVIESALKTLTKFDYIDFTRILFKNNPFNGDPEILSFQFWQILEKLDQHAGVIQKSVSGTNVHHQAAEYNVKMQLLERKVLLLQECSSNLSNRDKLLTIVYAQLDPDPAIQENLNQILTLDDVLALLRDESTPHSTVKRAINILKRHPSESVQKKVDDIFVLLSQRVQKQLKEMETTINAYFDIIFNSLGYPKVYRIRQAIKILSTTKEITGRFFRETHSIEEQNQLADLFQQIDSFYHRKLKEAHFNLNVTYIREIADVYEMVKLILGMPEQIVTSQGYLFDQDADDYENQIRKARLLWRTTTGQYLGRLKELAELFREKWLALFENEQQKADFNLELNSTLTELEKNYKNEIRCNLLLPCMQCSKRSCAADRFLNQIEFLLGEFLEYLEEDICVEAVQ